MGRDGHHAAGGSQGRPGLSQVLVASKVCPGEVSSCHLRCTRGFLPHHPGLTVSRHGANRCLRKGGSKEPGGRWHPQEWGWECRARVVGWLLSCGFAMEMCAPALQGQGPLCSDKISFLCGWC